MVHCRNLKNNECSYTGGRCILNNPTTIEQYKLCNGSVLAKDYSEMNRAEKAFVNSIENGKKLKELESRITRIENKKVRVIPRLPKDPPLETLQIGLEKTDTYKKKGGLMNWLRHLGK